MRKAEPNNKPAEQLLGAAMEHARRGAGLTLREMAGRTDGWNPQYIRNLETGKHWTTFVRQLKLLSDVIDNDEQLCRVVRSALGMLKRNKLKRNKVIS